MKDSREVTTQQLQQTKTLKKPLCPVFLNLLFHHPPMSEDINGNEKAAWITTTGFKLVCVLCFVGPGILNMLFLESTLPSISIHCCEVNVN